MLDHPHHIASTSTTITIKTWCSSLPLEKNRQEQLGIRIRTPIEVSTRTFDVVIMSAPQPPPKRWKRTKSEWRIFPSKTKIGFRVGDLVLFKSKDSSKAPAVRGSVVSIDKGRVNFLVAGEERILDTSEQKRLMPCFGVDSPAVVLTPETLPYRKLSYQVLPTDSVLEVGCSTGETSRFLIPLTKSWVGFDTSQEMIDQCKDHMNGTSCHIAKVDALKDPIRALKESKTLGDPNVIFVDIGGNRECINVLRMISWVLDSFGPRLLVVKSRELVQLVRSTASVDKGTGIIGDGQTWFQKRQQKRALPKHPLRAPLVLSPKDGLTPICRYHNYHKNGCSKGPKCLLDHNYCHACLELGHIARNCPTLVGKVQGDSTNAET